MAPSQAPTISLVSPHSSPIGEGKTHLHSSHCSARKNIVRNLSPTSCLTDTKSCPELGGDSRRLPMPPGSDSVRSNRTRGKKLSTFTRSYTDLSGDILPVPCGHSSIAKKVMRSGNINAQKKLQMDLHKLSLEKVKRAEEMTAKKLAFIQEAFKKSVTVATGREKHYKAIERRRAGTARSRGFDLPSLAPLGTTSMSRCSTAQAGSSGGSVITGPGSPSGHRRTVPAQRDEVPRPPVLKFPGIPDGSPATRRSPQFAWTNFPLCHNRRLLKPGESVQDLVEHNMMSTIRHVGERSKATPAKKGLSTFEDGYMWKNCLEDERFTKLQETLVPMWRTTSWSERVKTDNRDLEKPIKASPMRNIRTHARDTFGVGGQTF